ncbi:MAG TPA: hypothetical protein VLT15_05410 [Acidimicrobiia bacterium]|nr:hypothetical protein [Acidimicrobiia bacterium]
MGQKIEIASSTTIGDVAVFDTDRTLSGQDGERYRSLDETEGRTTYPAGVARAILSGDGAVQSVYITSNVVTIERRGGWDEESITEAGRLISDFFLFY